MDKPKKIDDLDYFVKIGIADDVADFLLQEGANGAKGQESAFLRLRTRCQSLAHTMGAGIAAIIAFSFTLEAVAAAALLVLAAVWSYFLHGLLKDAVFSELRYVSYFSPFDLYEGDDLRTLKRQMLASYSAVIDEIDNNCRRAGAAFNSALRGVIFSSVLVGFLYLCARFLLLYLKA